MTNYRITDFPASTTAMLAGACLVALLLAACVSDVRARRIPNKLVALIALLGLAYSMTSLSLMEGAGRAFVGLALGFALWVPFYALGMLGAGDVKLFAAGCCWLAPSQVFGAALVSALAGGVLSVIALVLSHGAGLTAFRLAEVARDPTKLGTPLKAPPGRPTVPYGIALAVGLALAGWVPSLSRLT